jgi:hypothetical protein
MVLFGSVFLGSFFCIVFLTFLVPHKIKEHWAWSLAHNNLQDFDLELINVLVFLRSFLTA